MFNFLNTCKYNTEASCDAFTLAPSSCDEKNMNSIVIIMDAVIVAVSIFVSVIISISVISVIIVVIPMVINIWKAKRRFIEPEKLCLVTQK
jgi:uncharacterized protein (DUF983 family)